MELEDLVGENDFSSRGAVVLCVELDRERAAVHDMERVDDVIEAVFDRDLEESVARGQAVVIGPAGVEKLAAAAGHLPGGMRDVLAEVARKWLGKRLEANLGPAGGRDFQK